MAGGEVAGVHHVDIVQILCGQTCVLVAGAEFGADVQVNDGVVVFAELGPKLVIPGHIVCGRLGQITACVHMGVDGAGGEIHAVVVISAAHGDGQGQNGDVVPRDLLGAEIAGRIRCYFDFHYKF